MIHLEHPIFTLRGRLETLKVILELRPEEKDLKMKIHQYEHAINILKKAEEKK